MTTKTTPAYWTTRNALVAAALAATPRSDCAERLRTPQDREAWAAYADALETLAAFDAATGGPPIL